MPACVILTHKTSSLPALGRRELRIAELLPVVFDLPWPLQLAIALTLALAMAGASLPRV